VVVAIEASVGARAEALVREHAHVVEESINLATLSVVPVLSKPVSSKKESA